MSSPSLEARLRGGLYGLLVGDALGVPYEFHDPANLPERVTMVPPEGFRRAHPGTPPGTWSDDGAHALCLLASLLSTGEVDLLDLGRLMLAWDRDGYMAVDGRVFDIGNATTLALARRARGVLPEACGGTHDHSNGNGSLMRVLPLALWHEGSDAELVHLARRQSLLTHAHPRSQACCALYCLWARRLLEGEPDSELAWAAAVAGLRAAAPEGDDVRTELDEVILDPRWVPRGTGYVLDCLLSAREAMQAGDYEAVVRAAVAFGHDTDTTACVAGGLAGIRDGLGAIPEGWLGALRGRDLCDPLVDELVRHRGER